MKPQSGFLILAMLFGLGFLACPLRSATLNDNFNATGSPDTPNDFNLNAELDVRQSGSLAPAMYTRIAGGANLVQVNNSTPDSYGSETGLGKMDFFNLDFSAVELRAVPLGNSVRLVVEATPVTNNAARDSLDWLCINVGATGGNGFVNNGQAGVGMLIRDNGGYQVFNNGPLIADGSVPAAGTYLIDISLNAAGDRYSLSINGRRVLCDVAVSTSGNRIQFGGIGGAPAGQPFNMHTLDNLSITTAPPSCLIDTVDYSDTFTLGFNGRANGVYNSVPPYAVENTHGNPASTWTPQTNYSFNDIPGSFGAGPVCLPIATGNPGAAGGIAQSGGGDFSFAYGLRTDFVIEMDAFLSPADRTDMSCLPFPGASIFDTPCLSIFFRRTTQGTGMIGIYNGSVETSVGSTGVDDDNWHKLAARFNQDDDRLTIYFDGEVKADLDLATFAGGAYRNYPNAAVGAGGAGAFFRDKVLWFDNFQVGSPNVFCDTFDRSDRPVDGSSVYSGGWDITSGELVTHTGGGEHWVWAGNPAVTTPENINFCFEMRFLSPGGVAGIGRHAGAMFCASEATERGSPSSRGYVLWWIDRAEDYGISLYRFDAGFNSFTPLHAGTFGAVVDPPLKWRIEVSGPSIKVFGDGVLYVDVVDNTYRGGYAGLWAWVAQDVAFDNVKISEPAAILVPCIEVGPERRATGCPISFDGSCSLSSSGAIVRYDWDFGDGGMASGAQVEHTYTAGGTRTVSLTVEDETGATATATQDILIGAVVLSYNDNFNRPGPAVSGLTVAQGPTWNMTGAKLAAGPTAQEHWIWAGSPPVYAPANAIYSFDYRFLAPGTNGVVGRHGGFQFCASRPTQRSGGGAFSGYFIDWIDRSEDRGVRLTRVDNGAFTELVRGQGGAAPPNPPLSYLVVVDGSRIQVYGDLVLYIDIIEPTHRGGFFGFWTWEGGQQVEIDNLTLDGEALSPCFTATPETPLAGAPVHFDAGCSEVIGCATSIVRYDWDFGDGTSASGVAADHVYAAPDVYTVTLTIEDSLGATASTSRLVSVALSLEGFIDCFDRPAGPVDGWTAALGNWTITPEGTVDVDTNTTGTEGFLYAGDPAGILPPNFTAEVDTNFIAGTNAAVGRHGAVHFCWNKTTTDRFAADSNGYAVFYIDRASDRGLTLARWDGTSFFVLNPPGGTPAFPDPPQTLRVEVSGPTISVYADGMLVIQANDSTYRGGLFALWSWFQNHIQFDNVRIWSAAEPERCGTTHHLAGDCNLDGTRDVADLTCYIEHLFPGFFILGTGTPLLPCAGDLSSAGNLAILDLNGDGRIDITEVVRLAAFLFMNGSPPPEGLGCFSVPPESECTSNVSCP